MLVSEMTFLRDHWHPVADAAAVAGPTTVRLFGEDYVLWPTGDGGFAMADPFCPHRSAHLAGGWVEGRNLVCPYHGWRFDGSGSCTLIPQLDRGLPTPPKADLATYPVVVRYGLVWACIGDPVSDGPPRWIEAEEADERGWRVYVEFFERWQVAAPRIIDNNLDSSHVAYVHRNSFGDPGSARMPPQDLQPTASGGFRSRLASSQPGLGVQLGLTTDETVRFERVSETELLAPLTTRTRMWFSGTGPDYCFYGAASPVDDEHSIFVRLSALSGTPEEQPWERFHAFGTRVKEEDRVILESTVPDFPVDITSEVHLRCDKVTLEYRRYLARCLGATPTAMKESA
jgi:phenylpropionate dioxygenase-like ring-hydroxylating dioxygenase large terminal subunit